MTQTKHTPGPWALLNPQINRNCVVNLDAGGEPLAVIALSAEHEDIGFGRLTKSEYEANARLIASAPDLLEACLFVRSSLLPYDGDALSDTRREQIDALLCAAIAKAGVK